MTSKKTIVKLIELTQELDKTDKPIECAIIVNDIQKTVDAEVDKQLNILIVGSQRELLIDFLDWQGQNKYNGDTDEEIADWYLKHKDN